MAGQISGSVSRQVLPDNISSYTQSYSAGHRGASESYSFTKGGIAKNNTNAVEGIQSLDLRDLEDRANETKRE